MEHTTDLPIQHSEQKRLRDYGDIEELKGKYFNSGYNGHRIVYKVLGAMGAASQFLDVENMSIKPIRDRTGKNIASVVVTKQARGNDVEIQSAAVPMYMRTNRIDTSYLHMFKDFALEACASR